MLNSASRGGAMIVALAAAAVLVACGSDSSSTSSGSASNSSTSQASALDKQVAAQVPAAIKSKGTLTVAADASYPPNEFIGTDGKTVEGMDADLAKALAGVLGLKANVVNATFDGIIPGLAANKYDLGMSSFTDTKEREKTVDFVTYFSAGTSFYVKAQGGPTINTLADLCGHKVAVEKGTTQADDADRAEQEVHGGRQAGRDRVGLPRPERREPGALERPRRGRHGRLARRRLPGQAVQRPVQAHRASPTARRRTASRSPRTAAWTSRVLAAREGADRQRRSTRRS